MRFSHAFAAVFVVSWLMIALGFVSGVEKIVIVSMSWLPMRRHGFFCYGLPVNASGFWSHGAS